MTPDFQVKIAPWFPQQISSELTKDSVITSKRKVHGYVITNICMTD